VVHSNDFAGFIGNGHFMRDALHGISKVNALSGQYSFVQAVTMVNKVTQDYLVRPMGIFQLIDYVGIDVMQFIMNVMNPHNPSEDLHSDLLDELMTLGVKGGQNSDGSQKDGFFQYEKGRIKSVYNLDTKSYQPIEEVMPSADAALGQFPVNAIAWKNAIKDAQKDAKLNAFFGSLKTNTDLGASLAVEYGKKSCAIGQKLVDDGVALNAQDVNTVMMTGFFHAYGPVNEYFK